MAALLPFYSSTCHWISARNLLNLGCPINRKLHKSSERVNYKQTLKCANCARRTLKTKKIYLFGLSRFSRIPEFFPSKYEVTISMNHFEKKNSKYQSHRQHSQIIITYFNKKLSSSGTNLLVRRSHRCHLKVKKA